MVIDTRRDHSIRVPRPDLSVALGTPNAFTQCHAGSFAEWAAQTVAGWHPRGRQTTPHYGTVLHAGRIGATDAEQQLDRLILDQSQPAIVRATALPLLAPYASSAWESAMKVVIADADPLVRLAAPRALPASPPRDIVQMAARLLGDPVRAVRIEAARALAGTDLLALTPEQHRLRQGHRWTCRCRDSRRRPARGTYQSRALGSAAPRAARGGKGVPHGAASGSKFRPGTGQSRRSRSGMRHGRSRRGIAEAGDGDRGRQRRCPVCARPVAGAAALIEVGRLPDPAKKATGTEEGAQGRGGDGGASRRDGRDDSRDLTPHRNVDEQEGPLRRGFCLGYRIASRRPRGSGLRALAGGIGST
jgi:hypothetical protein